MMKDEMLAEIRKSAEYFHNTTECLGEGDSSYAPNDSMYTVAQQVAHVAQTIDWFIEGMFSPKGFNLAFEEHMKELAEVTSLEFARKWFHLAIERAKGTILGRSEEELGQPLPDGPVLGGLPRRSVIPAMTDHTAHHRGSLAVYARMLGKVPKMPYGEM